ncbi:NUDIX domain-containing protein [Nostoc linckia]|uniref:NUDIX domain-containing protein n=1 Tax=Nostoc linckia TaxID=92942 RepID=UPI000BFF86A2|nr:NUDIX domain-containing protein [Nostoc linckia]PHJ94838.1 DNA mismatch repair protein MutT [Nostoc linckia z9]
MPISSYVASLRKRVGPDLLLLPAVTAVIRSGPRFLLARQRDSDLWSLIGGGIEPGEEPSAALMREVVEELGVTPVVGRIIGAYGGEALESVYPNGDRVSYVTVAYECTLPDDRVNLDRDELLEVAWFVASAVSALPRHEWIDRVIDDCSR